jgi:hypothetical protein
MDAGETPHFADIPDIPANIRTSITIGVMRAIARGHAVPVGSIPGKSGKVLQ